MAVRVGGKGRGRGLGRLKRDLWGKGWEEGKGGGGVRKKGELQENIERSLERKCD